MIVVSETETDECILVGLESFRLDDVAFVALKDLYEGHVCVSGGIGHVGLRFGETAERSSDWEEECRSGKLWKDEGLEKFVLKRMGMEMGAQRIHAKIYRLLFQGIAFQKSGLKNCDCVPQFINITSLGMRVSRLHPSWYNQDFQQTHINNFITAVEVLKEEILRVADQVKNVWLPTYSVTLEMYKHRKDYHASGRIGMLKEGCNWKTCIHEVEDELEVSDDDQLWWVISHSGRQWRLTAVANRGSHFDQRSLLPEPWRGLREDELKKISGIASAEFVHPTGFTGGAMTEVDVLAMAEASMKETFTTARNVD